MTTGIETNKGGWWARILIAALATITLLLVSPDSYLHDLFNRVDSAWFYMCGKAWMNGMTPYVDFTDSKGPMLWLIYGLGYLLSPHDYTGIFWLSCIGYAITLWLIYRSALLLLGDYRWALLCAVLMPLAYFYPHIHEEIKTEDFAQPLIALCLYCYTLLQQRSRLRRNTIAWCHTAMGACLGCVLMMKYSFVPMLGIIVVFALVAARHHGMGIMASIMWVCAGIIVALLPWAVYFAIAGNFTAFINEYFINTIDTLQHLRHQNGTIIDILRKFRLHHAVTVFPLLCFGGALIHALCFARHRWFAIVTTIVFFACTIPNAWWIYYYNTCTWTLYFGITALVIILQQRLPSPARWTVTSIAVAVAAAAGTWSIAIKPQNFFTHPEKARNTYYRYVYLLQQVEKPRVVYWDIYSCGFETAAMGLPACKYWAGQNGATPAMQQAQRQAVKDGAADFVFVADTIHDRELRQWGYQRWDYSDRNNTNGCDDLLYTLYTRHRLQPPPPDFTPPGPKEILFKKWHLQ